MAKRDIDEALAKIKTANEELYAAVAKTFPKGTLLEVKIGKNLVDYTVAGTYEVMLILKPVEGEGTLTRSYLGLLDQVE